MNSYPISIFTSPQEIDKMACIVSVVSLYCHRLADIWVRKALCYSFRSPKMSFLIVLRIRKKQVIFLPIARVLSRPGTLLTSAVLYNPKHFHPLSNYI